MTEAPERKKPGRKPMGAGEGKTARVELRVLPGTKAAWLARADAAGLTLQAWVEKRCNARFQHGPKKTAAKPATD